ncbi:MAG: GNAT family N-acetyltransferase [Mycobacteriales bacterium]
MAETTGVDEPLAELQVETQEAQWSAAFGDDRHWVLEVDGQQAGRLWVGERDESDVLVDVRLLPTYQHRGIARQLVSHVVAEAVAANRAVELTVERANARAYRLYTELGFVERGGDELRVTMRREPPGDLAALRELVWSAPDVQDQLFAHESPHSFVSAVLRLSAQQAIPLSRAAVEEALAVGRQATRTRWVE